MQIKILDFGLAKEVEDTEKTSSIGEIVGSPYYMSPEQIRGGEIGFPSDVYQLGLVLYRALSGRHPFEHTSTMEVIFKQLNQRPERLAPVENGLPRFLRVGWKRPWKKRRPSALATPAPWPISLKKKNSPGCSSDFSASRAGRANGVWPPWFWPPWPFWSSR